MPRKLACVCWLRWCIQGWTSLRCLSTEFHVSADTQEVNSGIIFQWGDSTPHAMHLHGADGQQLQRGAFILKDETNKEQTSHIVVQWSFVSSGSDEHRGGHSAWDQLRGPGHRICKEESMKSFTALKWLHVQYRLTGLSCRATLQCYIDLCTRL